MSNQPKVCEMHCASTKESRETQLIVITGGPGAGKTAVLEMSKKVLCEHVAIFPRRPRLFSAEVFGACKAPRQN